MIPLYLSMQTLCEDRVTLYVFGPLTLYHRVQLPADKLALSIDLEAVQHSLKKQQLQSWTR